MRATLTHDGEPLRPEGASKSAERESAGHIDHIDHASQKCEQNQIVNGPMNVIGSKSRRSRRSRSEIEAQ
jgi:hypothetical protein